MIVSLISSYRLFFETQGRKYGRNLKLVMFAVYSLLTRKRKTWRITRKRLDDRNNIYHVIYIVEALCEFYESYRWIFLSKRQKREQLTL